jgi:hypothetical protein
MTLVEKLTLNYLATALVDIPAVSMPIARSLNFRHLWHCVVTKLHILEWPFVPSTRCTCVIIMLFIQLHIMPHLSDRWLWQRRHAHERGCKTNLCTKFERNKLFVHMDNFCDLLFQLMEHGTNALHVAFMFLFSMRWKSW